MVERSRTLVIFALLALPGCGSGGGSAADADGDVTADTADAGPDEVAPDEGSADRADEASEARDEASAEDAAVDDAPTCTSTTDPLTLWREQPELNMVGSGPLTRLGNIEGPCVVDGYRVVAALGMHLHFEANTTATTLLTPRLHFYDARAFAGPGAPVLADAVGAPGYTAILDVNIPAGGEYLLLVYDQELRDPGAYALSATCTAGCSKKATRFPIVLLHGFGGWDSILGGLDYFYGVRGDLASLGYDVYVPEADSVNDTPTRAAQYATQIDAILASTHARKVDLVAHSQGGLDARYLISTLGYGDRIGALAMIATPNQGTVVADALIGDLPVSAAILSGLLDAWGAILGSNASDTRAAFEQLATIEVQNEFNPLNPDDPRVTYWSWAGSSCALLDFSCQAADSGEIVDPMLAISYDFLTGADPGHGPNDGLVTVASGHWGTYQGTLPADHWDEIGQLADSGAVPFDHLAFYRDLAAKLCNSGF